jgi:hypothetical protein
VNARRDSAGRPFPAWIPVLVLTALAFWIRIRGLPGSWGSDSLTYLEACRSGAPGTTDPRAERWLALTLVRGALRLGGESPASASVPGVILSAAVVPVLWLGLRRRLGDTLALLPCVLWTFLGLALEEVVEISTDVLAALPTAFAVWGLAEAARRTERRILPLVAAGVALGVGATLKESALFALAGFSAGALTIGRGRERWRHAALVALPGLALFAAGVLFVNPKRVGDASAYMAWDPAFIPAGGAAFVRRVTIEIPQALLTATGAYGLLFVAALPLLVRLPFRALRGDALAAASLAGLLAFDVLPISFAKWSLLPASRPRYLLCLMPVLLAALADALRERPATRAERGASLAAALLGLAFVGRAPWTLVVLPVGLVLTAWTSFPDRVRERLDERTRLALAAAALLATTVAWRSLPSMPTSAEWIVAGAAGVVVTAPWLVGRDRGGPAPYAAVGGALVLAIAMARARFVPDPGWDVWSHLPPAGRVYAESIAGRRLLAAATSAGADERRVVLLAPDAAPPSGLAPEDRVVARDLPLAGGATNFADACRMPDSGLVRVPAGLGETLIFEPSPR